MSTPTDLVLVTASALAAALPLPSVPTAGQPVGIAALGSDPSYLLPAAPGAAVLARVAAAPGSVTTGELAVIVAADLVEALATSPLGVLDLASAVQPALDAAAQAAGGARAEAGQQLTVELALDTLLARPDAFFVPLTDAAGAVTATVVVALTVASVAQPGFAVSGGPGSAPADARTITSTIAPQVHPAPQGGGAASAMDRRGGLNLLRDVAMEITVELGRTRMTVRELLSLSAGAVVELDRAAGSPADLLVNGTLIARGEVVVVDEDFGIRITEIVTPATEAATSGASGPPTGQRGAA